MALPASWRQAPSGHATRDATRVAIGTQDPQHAQREDAKPVDAGAASPERATQRDCSLPDELDGEDRATRRPARSARTVGLVTPGCSS